MWALLARFAPSLVPGLSALLNPWILLGILSAVSGSFLFGMHVMSKQLQSYEAAVGAVGEAQEKWTLQTIKQQKRISQEAVNALKKELGRTKRDNDVLLASLREHANRSVLPPDRAPTGGGTGSSTVCFDRQKLDAGIRRSLATFLERLAPIFQRGDVALAVMDACVNFTEAQHALNPGNQE